jgi:hypothetical protein
MQTAVLRNAFAASFSDSGVLETRSLSTLDLSGKPAALWLSSSEPSGVVRGALLATDIRQGCLPSGAFRDRGDVWDIRAGNRQLVARVANSSDLEIPWADAPGIPTIGSTSSAGWSLALMSGDVLFRPWSASSAVPITHSDTPVYSMASIDDAVVFVGRIAQPRASLWISRLGGTPRQLWTSELTVLRVGVTRERHVVWLAASGPRASEGVYETARWYDAMLTDALELTGERAGPQIAVNSGLLNLVVGGTMAASSGCAQTDGSLKCITVVFDWQTRQTWSLGPRPGWVPLGVLAIDTKQLLLAENTMATPASSQFLEGLVLLSTSQLARVEKAW